MKRRGPTCGVIVVARRKLKTMDRRAFLQASVGAAAASASDADRVRDCLTSKSDATSDPILPLLSNDESARLGERLGIDRSLATSNVFRGLLNSPSATAGFYGVFNALLFCNKVAARTRELIILRIGWRTGSEYVFCNHVRFSRELGISDKEILGVRDPQRCHAYSETDRTVLHLADELHERSEVTRSTWAVLEKAFARDELVELLLIAGSGGWRRVSSRAQRSRLMQAFQVGRKAGNPTTHSQNQKCLLNYCSLQKSNPFREFTGEAGPRKTPDLTPISCSEQDG